MRSLFVVMVVSIGGGVVGERVIRACGLAGEGVVVGQVTGMIHTTMGIAAQCAGLLLSGTSRPLLRRCGFGDTTVLKKPELCNRLLVPITNLPVLPFAQRGSSE